jgi:hypothetical protein
MIRKEGRGFFGPITVPLQCGDHVRLRVQHGDSPVLEGRRAGEPGEDFAVGFP